MKTNLLQSFFGSKFGKLIVAAIVILVLLTKVVPGFIDTEPHVAQVVAALEKNLDAEVVINGSVVFKILPQPTLQIYDLRIASTAEDSPTVHIARLDTQLDFMDIFSAAPRPQLITLWEPDIRLKTTEDDRLIWGFLGVPLFKNLSKTSSGIEMGIAANGGQLVVENNYLGTGWAINRINVSGKWANLATVSGSFEYRDQAISLNASRTGSDGITPFMMNLSQGADQRLTIKGEVDLTSDTPLVEGAIEIVSSNIVPFVFPEEAKVKSALEIVNNQTVAVEKQEVILPLKLTANYRQTSEQLTLSDMLLESGQSKATGQFDWEYAETVHQDMSLSFSLLDITPFYPFIFQDDKKKSVNFSFRDMLADRGCDLSFDISAKQVIRDKQKWDSAHFNGTISDGALTVNQFNISLPGESELYLFGLISQTDVQGLRFEGSIEAYGQSLRELLTVFDESAGSLPELGFGQFRVRSNLFISSELLRLSEADMQFSEILLKGGLVTYFDTTPRIEAEVRLNDINFDYVRDVWRERAEQNVSDNYFIHFNEQLDYEWLKKLAASIDFTVEVDGFNFLERKGKAASFRIFAQAGEFGIYNAKFNFGTDITEANFILNVKDVRPSINLALNTNTFSTDYFAITPVAPPPEPIPVDNIVTPVEPDDLAPPTAPSLLDEVDLDSDTGYGEETEPVVTPLLPEQEDVEAVVTTTPQSLLISDALAQRGVRPNFAGENKGGWSENLIDLSWMETVNGTFDISIGRLQHQSRDFQNFKMFAKLERNLLTFQTLTFAHWNGSFSINGTLYGGKVPGMSMGFVIASADLRKLLGNILGINELGGRVSVSGTVETSGVNMLSWVSQANAQILFAGRGVNIRGFDVASVLTAVSASRTAADTFNNVNRMLVSGTGEYSLDGTINVQNGIMSTAGISMKTERILGNIKGELRLIPWTLAMSGVFQFPQLSADTVPSMTVQWDGPLANPTFQVDTQSLEAFVSKRIIGN